MPQKLENCIKCGTKVKVPFGRGNVLRSGIVLSVFSGINSELKEIHSADDKIIPLDEEMIQLALWLKERCFCTTYDCLRQMLPRGVDKISDKSSRMIRLCKSSVVPKLTPKQQSVYQLLCDVGCATVNEVTEFCSVGKGVLDNLVKYNVCEYFEKEVYRMPYKNISESGNAKPIVLSKEQHAAFDVYNKMLHNGGGTGLLFGVTGSGKTQVYLSLIDEAVSMDKDVIVLVPEISLTPQMLSIFHERYGRRVAVLHSGLSIGERSDEYKRAARGEAKSLWAHEVLFLRLFTTSALSLWMRSRSTPIKASAPLAIMRERLQISGANIKRLCF